MAYKHFLVKALVYEDRSRRNALGQPLLLPNLRAPPQWELLYFNIKIEVRLLRGGWRAFPLFGVSAVLEKEVLNLFL